ncbi:MAG: ABC transporter permease, partial [Actinomycetales bacterium]
MTVLTHGLLMARRDLKHWQREPWGPIFGVAFSLMLL